MLQVIDRRVIPFQELRDRLSHTEAEAIENIEMQLLPILQDYYWQKIWVAKHTECVVLVALSTRLVS